jgi:hypothetical protein
MKINTLLIGLIIILLITILLNSFLYYGILIAIIALLGILLFFNKNNRFLILFFIIIFSILFKYWHYINLNINKKKYYHSFQSLSKIHCLGGYDFIEKKPFKNINCKALFENKSDSVLIDKILLDNKELLNYLNKLGCNQMDIAPDMVQFWFKNEVFTMEYDSIKNNINIDISALH